ncbi:argonaute-like protein [Rhizoctonia solani]|uniref:Argonaute-like protein n=1 Tax=Rhizoctonia solani TaxID=456999 RepID=A0A8H8SYQ6_9AGAM|nr:argonaute-like protein [Rhizoctonia solani]QRW22769.1 argonaute-like protein [Rhizoctonia solani]
MAHDCLQLARLDASGEFRGGRDTRSDDTWKAGRIQILRWLALRSTPTSSFAANIFPTTFQSVKPLYQGVLNFTVHVCRGFERERGRGAPRGGPGGYGRGGGGGEGGRGGERGPQLSVAVTEGVAVDSIMLALPEEEAPGGVVGESLKLVPLSSIRKLAVDDDQLPRRPDYGKVGQSVVLRTNYFPVEYKKAKIFDYDISVEPEGGVKRIMKQLLALMMSSSDFAPYAAFAAHDNANRLVSMKEIPATIRLMKIKDISNFAEANEHTLVGQMQPSTPNLCSLRSTSYVQVPFSARRDGGHNKWFFPSLHQSSDIGVGLEAYRGYFSSVRPSFQQLMVNVNVATTVFYKPGPLASYSSIWACGATPIKVFVHKLRIEMRHTGRVMRKQIKGLRLDSNARTYLFKCDEYNNEKISVEAYIKGPFRGKLPDEYGAAMIRVACQPPNVNATSIIGEGLSSLGLVGDSSPLEQMGIRVKSQMATVPGRILPAPKVHYNNRASVHVSNGSWNLRDVRFAVGTKLDNWAVLFIQDGGRDDLSVETGGPIAMSFAAICGKVGMAVNTRKAPPMRDVSLPSKKEDASPLTRPRAVDTIRRALLTINPKPKIVLIVLSNQDKAIYNGIKHLCDVYLDVLTVCVQASKFKDNKAQYNSNVAMKFNTKLGGINHSIDPQDKTMAWIRAQPTMMVGSDVTHPSPGSFRGTPSIAAVVASVDNQFGQFPASLRLQQSKKEMITDLTDMMIERLIAYRTKNNTLPRRIIFFRDGVSEGQFYTVRDDELPKVDQAFAKFNQDGKPYKPKLTILIAGKRHHTRFFPTKLEDSDKGNCRPGTVVDRGASAVYDFDFISNHMLDFKVQLAPRITLSCCVGCPPAYYADLACERGRCYLYELLNASEGAASIKSGSSSDEEVLKKAHDLWRRGPTGPIIKDTMFYI